MPPLGDGLVWATADVPAFFAAFVWQAVTVNATKETDPEKRSGRAMRLKFIGEGRESFIINLRKRARE
jgi:hypothetical protein